MGRIRDTSLRTECPQCILIDVWLLKVNLVHGLRWYGMMLILLVLPWGQLTAAAHANTGWLQLVPALGVPHHQVERSMELGRAVQRFEFAVARHANYASARRGLGLSHALLGQTDDATSSWMSVTDAQAWLIRYGDARRLAKQRLDALSLYRVADRLHMDSPQLWLGVGLVCRDVWASDALCQRFLEQGVGNLLVDPNLSFGAEAWRFNRREGDLGFRIEDCPQHDGAAQCARVSIGAQVPRQGASWHQCVQLTPGETYRVSTWVRVDTTPEGEWIPLYLQGKVNGGDRGYWPSTQKGGSDWRYWEWEFAAPSFDDGRVCFYPLRLMASGSAWFREPVLRSLEPASTGRPSD